MTPFKLIMSIIVATLVLSYFIYPDPELEPVDPAQLPWHVDIDEAGNSTVFGLVLNQSSLQDAYDVFGEADNMALYASADKPSIEVYFGYIKKAGLTAQVIITHTLSTAEAEAFLSNASSRMQTNSDIPKVEINAAERYKVLDMVISSITYIPKYTGLDLDYLLDRFGQPSHYIRLSDTAQQLFYKDSGLSVISDSEGKEVFQYTQPGVLVIPDGASVYE